MKNLCDLTPQEEKAVVLFRKSVQKICGASDFELRLFGSRARLEGDEESDFDILVLLSRYDEQTKVKIWDAAHAVFDQTEIFLSAHVLSRDRYENLKKRERLIAQEIERDGIIL